MADALYLNAPFINTVLVSGMDVAIRMKDEKGVLYQDAFCHGGREKEGIPKRETADRGMEYQRI